MVEIAPLIAAKDPYDFENIDWDQRPKDADA